MSLLALSTLITSKLIGVNFRVVNAKTSIYIMIEGVKVKQIRVSNHNGHKSKRNCLQFRTDAMTSEKNGVYNMSSINRLIERTLN
jgi:RNase P/RNase MRP subunit p29